MNAPDSAPAAKPLVDFDQLQSACDGDVGLMRELVELYFRQAAEIMGGLDVAIKTGEIPEVDHLAHKLAGSSLACGMSAVVAPSRALEQGAKAGHLQNAGVFYAQACEQIQAVREHVQEYLRRQPSQ